MSPAALDAKTDPPALLSRPAMYLEGGGRGRSVYEQADRGRNKCVQREGGREGGREGQLVLECEGGRENGGG